MAPNSAVKPPVGRPIGYTDLNAYNQFTATDPGEHIGDLLFPQSVTTYSMMRRDPQIAAVLAGISLPIRRATWAIDPTGCNPKVAARVADDMGLPLVGVDDPGPARTRGMSWPDHLRTALLSLVYGFYGYELVADVSSGQARLVNAYQRHPSTVVFIHSLPNGDFGGISQLYHPDTLQQAEIGPERMCWYALDVEGSAHHGTSILRPGYSSWLIKQSLRRVLAVSNERFGMGVPTIEWATNATPTPGQMQAAQQAASAARVGETAGLALPPGAQLALKGLSGGTPNTIEALRWVDQQMSGMVLSRWMDLGSSQTGSRALGEAFIDTFLLSIQSVADALADAATRQISARLVAWNEGVDEPVPRVVVADVGSRHEVTADALGALLQSGALSADPQLEEWVRRTYRLPPRDPNVPWKPPQVKGGGGKGDGSVTDHMSTVAASSPVAAAAPKRRTRKPVAAGQTALPIAAADGQRDLSADEQASGVDFAQIQAEHDAATAALVAAAPGLLAPIAVSLVAEVAAALASGSVAALGSLIPDADAVAALGDGIAERAIALARTSADRAAGELAGIGAPVDGVTVDEAAIADQAQATAQLIASGMANAASRTALLHSGPGVDASTVTDAVRVDLDALVADERNWVTGSLSAAMSAAQHAGRYAAFATLAATDAGLSVTWVASEVNDHGRCQPCAKIDGTRFPSFEEAAAAYPSGRYRACLGRDRCRGTLFAVAT